MALLRPIKNYANSISFFLLSIFLLLLFSCPAFAANPVIYADKIANANAVIAIGEDSSVLYSKNASLRLPPASTTKLVTAMVVLDMIEPDRIVNVSRTAASTPSVSPRLRPFENFLVQDLLNIALIRSVNAAAVALAEETAGTEDAFVYLMNDKVRKLGAVNTKFVNASGLPDDIQYTTVYDLTLILKEALKYPLIKEILGKKEERVVSREGRTLFVQNTDRMLWASDKMIGGKTGYTRAAQHCFVGALETDDGLVYTAVLGARSRGALWANTGTLMGLTMPRDNGPAIASIKSKNAKKSKYAKSGKCPRYAKAVKKGGKRSKTSVASKTSRAKQYASAAKLKAEKTKKKARAVAAKKKSRSKSVASAGKKRLKTASADYGKKPSLLASAK